MNLSKKEEVIKGIQQEIEPDDNLEFVALNLTDDAGWDEAMEGCNYVLHVASPFIMKEPKNEQDYIRPAKEGTLRVLRAAKKAGIKKVVVTSSLVTMAGNMKEGCVDQSSWSNETTDDLSVKGGAAV